MKTVKALRGVCVSPSRHLAVGDVAELDDGTAQFLVSIKAVEAVEPVVEPEPKPVEPESKPTPAKKPGSKEK